MPQRQRREIAKSTQQLSGIEQSEIVLLCDADNGYNQATQHLAGVTGPTFYKQEQKLISVTTFRAFFCSGDA